MDVPLYYNPSGGTRSLWPASAFPGLGWNIEKRGDLMSAETQGNRVWLWLTLPLAILLAIAAGSGVWPKGARRPEGL